MTVFSDPLAANLGVLGIIFFGIGSYAIYKYFMNKDNSSVNQGFAYFLFGTGFYSVIYGLFYSLLWPEPEGGAYSILFGDPLTLLGFVELFAGYTLLKNSDMFFVGLYGFFAGIYGIVSGYEGYLDGMTKSPLAMFLLYLGAGVTGLLVWPLVISRNKYIGILVGIVAILTGIMALIIGLPAIGEHLTSFAHAP